MDYIMLLETICIDPDGNIDPNGTTFWEGVSFEYEYDDLNNAYKVNQDDVSYLIDTEYVIVTQRPTRLVNESYEQYRTNKHMDKTKDYFKAVEKIMGIDMKINYAPQFRDGVNPHKDGNKNKEVNN